ncbi:MAG TPA: phenylalanine--tRNA ligase subunit beta [Burkholderiales bacterium]|nr:phenylalanine--tRNA ligase subunit beta [Burkholderiales bacterium]
MQFSERWLRSFVDPPLATDELARLLTMSGVEVETCLPVAPPFSGVVVGQILSAQTHPNADRLTVCSVDVAKGAPLQIVCGAPNVVAGMKAPVALVGAKLPGELEIKAASVRGAESRGMLCSARELGLSEDHSGLLALPANAPLGRDVREVLALDDRIFVLKVTPNRADCLSVLGVAREVSALTRAKLHAPEIKPVQAAIDARFPVKISEASGCGRFAGRVIRNVNASALTPAWMKERLERAGQRPISALVDVTNYVMLELGRPLHVYDLDKLAGGIDVRFGRKGERVKLLNDMTVEVDETVLCITDRSGPIGLGGIMGGESTKADFTTRNVFLESAFFYPAAVAGRARRFNFSSDASHRFERGVDFDNNVTGIERATRLLMDVCGGEPGPTVDTVAKLPERRPVRMRVTRAHKILGVPVPAAEIADIFGRLGLRYSRDGSDEDAFVVKPPSFRFDIEIEEDLIEEVARVHGFDRIPARPPRAPAVMRPHSEARRSPHVLRQRLADADYQEAINFSFVDSQWETDFAGESNPIRVVNPIASQMAVMRSTLIGSLVANVVHNAARKAPRVRLFELGRVYLRDPAVKESEREVAGIRQPTRLGAIAYGPALEEQWAAPDKREVDFYDVKADVDALVAPHVARYEAASHPALHPGRSARVTLDGAPIGWVGELHPRWRQKYGLPLPAALFELEVEALAYVGVPRYREVSKYPPVVRDRAMEFDDSLPAARILEEMKRNRPPLVREIRLFDFYRGKGVESGKKSLAFRVVMQDTARTLTDAEADAAMAQLTELLAAKFGAKLRT